MSQALLNLISSMHVKTQMNGTILLCCTWDKRREMFISKDPQIHTSVAENIGQLHDFDKVTCDPNQRNYSNI